MLVGADVSHWRGKIDWVTAAAHIRFAILKCTEGTGFIDDTYNFNKAGCEINQVPHGAYHFFHSNLDGIAQAEHFYNTANDSNLKFYAVDVETYDGGDIRANLKTMLERLEQLSGQVPWIYTAYYFWKDKVGAQPWASRCPLWVANYGIGPPMLPPGWSEWGIWQYSSHGVVPGINGDVDMNYFAKSEAYLPIVFGNGEVPPPPQYYNVRTTAGSLYVRNAPRGIIKGYVPYGTRFQVIGEAHDNTGYRWLRVGDNSYVGASWTEVIE